MSIDNVTRVRGDISEMLEKIRNISTKTQVFSETAVTPTKDFTEIMSVAKSHILKVSELQTEAESIKNAYISGNTNISMAQVAIASQKSKLAFEGLIAVRNKILEAYKDIMNMPV
jgi:flagellar hook-basal body complex protein FliE